MDLRNVRSSRKFIHPFHQNQILLVNSKANILVFALSDFFDNLITNFNFYITYFQIMIYISHH